MSIIDVFVVNDDGKVASMRAFWGGEKYAKARLINSGSDGSLLVAQE